MKAIKLLSILAFAVSVLVLPACKKCRNENPRARIINNNSQKASVQIQTSGGNTVNLNNVQPGEVSEFVAYEEGNVQFTVSAGNKTNVVSHVSMSECYEYDIAINEDGTVYATATDRND